jgi:biofilm PGA synthesis protein PgaA
MVGGYWQQNFGADPVGGVRYEHVWQAGPRFFLLYGASWGYAVYDGDDENRLAVHLDLNWRF